MAIFNRRIFLLCWLILTTTYEVSHRTNYYRHVKSVFVCFVPKTVRRSSINFRCSEVLIQIRSRWHSRVLSIRLTQRRRIDIQSVYGAYARVSGKCINFLYLIPELFRPMRKKLAPWIKKERPYAPHSRLRYWACACIVLGRLACHKGRVELHTPTW